VGPSRPRGGGCSDLNLRRASLCEILSSPLVTIDVGASRGETVREAHVCRRLLETEDGILDMPRGEGGLLPFEAAEPLHHSVVTDAPTPTRTSPSIATRRAPLIRVRASPSTNRCSSPSTCS